MRGKFISWVGSKSVVIHRNKISIRQKNWRDRGWAHPDTKPCNKSRMHTMCVYYTLRSNANAVTYYQWNQMESLEVSGQW